MTGPRPLVRIAHAYGNRREALERALAADVDMIELDMWFRAGDIEVRHERRLSFLPLLYDRRLPTHSIGSYAIRVWRYFVRPDVHPLKLDDVLELVSGKKRLLLDVKGDYGPQDVERYVETLLRLLRKHEAEGWVTVCGQFYAPLNALRRAGAPVEIRYSIEHPVQWEAFLGKMRRHEQLRQVCMAYRFIDEEKARILEENGVDLYCWTVDDPREAKRLVAEGVDGIISNDLEMLADMRNWPRPNDNTPSRSP